jgi:hypothetical protein
VKEVRVKRRGIGEKNENKDMKESIKEIREIEEIAFFVFCNPILFATCTSTFSKLCKTYTVACRRVLTSTPL